MLSGTYHNNLSDNVELRGVSNIPGQDDWSERVKKSLLEAQKSIFRQRQSLELLKVEIPDWELQKVCTMTATVASHISWFVQKHIKSVKKIKFVKKKRGKQWKEQEEGPFVL